MIVRKLNEQGLHDFDQFVVHLRNGNQQNTPAHLLTDPLSSEAIETGHTQQASGNPPQLQAPNCKTPRLWGFFSVGALPERTEPFSKPLDHPTSWVKR